jgi:phosphoribosylformimino-5-aminoimidazole carboxamide ribotide isomerase
MMIYPAVDIRMGRCVRLEQGDFNRSVQVAESPLSAARTWEQKGAQWLHVVDLDGARSGYPCNLSRVAEMATGIKIPIQLGGGIRTEQHIAEALAAGVSRIILGTRALQDPVWVARMVQRYPGQIRVGVDARDGKVAVRGWHEDTEEDVLTLALRMQDAGVEEIIYTDIRRDGMLNGPDLAGLTALLDAGLTVIASGGVSTREDLYRLRQLQERGLSGVIIGKALYSGHLTLSEAQEILTLKAGEKAC